MTDNSTNAEQHAGSELGELMGNAERIATRTLVDDLEELEGVQGREAFDSIFTALSHPGRRYILTYLLRAEGYVTMTELIDYVMDRASSTDRDDDLRQRITVKLTHTHLPKLVDEGFVDYNMERQLISPTEKLQLVDPYLKVALTQQEQFHSSRSE